MALKKHERHKRWFILLGVLICFFGLMFSSCSRSTKDLVVTFDYNYEHAPKSEKIKMRQGESIKKPLSPTRDGYVFIGWYNDPNSVDIFDYSKKVFENTTIYAGWLSQNDENLSKYLETLLSDISIEYVSGDVQDSITENIGLPEQVGEFPVKWSSNNDSIITNTGTVHRPVGNNAVVTLSATISIGSVSKEKAFDLTVIRQKNYNLKDFDDLTIDDIENMSRMNSYPFNIEYGEQSNEDISILGNFSNIIVESKEDAQWCLGNVRSLIGIDDPINELQSVSGTHDQFGSTYIFNQVVENIEVYGRTAAVTSNSAGVPIALNSNIIGIESINTKISIDEDTIKTYVTTELKDGNAIENISLVIFSLYEYESNPTVAYKITTSKEELFYDANSGKEIMKFSRIHTDRSVLGNGDDEKGDKKTFPIEYKDWDWFFYYMTDVERDITMYEDHYLLSDTRIGSEFNSWPDATAISAYCNMIVVYDWWNATFNRDSVDDNSLPIKVVVHDKTMTDNAYWSPNDLAMHFCDNSDKATGPSTAGALDVIAHEYTHGVFEFTTGDLPYFGATGAINEGYADIFGCFVDGNWTIGEDWKLIRDVSNPNSTGQPSSLFGDYYVDYTQDNSDNGGVHTNSLIISHAAYLMNSYGIAEDDLQNLWYLSLRQGYNATSDFYSVRRNIIKSAYLLDFSIDYLNIIKRAFDEVNIKIDETITSFTMPNKLTVTLGEVSVIEPLIEPEGITEYTLNWSSSDESIATVSPVGKCGIVTAISTGETEITATAVSGEKTIVHTTTLRVASQARDTILVLDVSGSMSGTPMEEMKKSAIQFCTDLLEDEYNNRVGLVYYDSNVQYIPLTSDLSSLIQAVNNLSPGDMTNMAGGLEMARLSMDNRGRADAIKNIVVMADGLPNEGKTSNSESFGTSSGWFSYGYAYENAVVDEGEAIKAKYNLYSLGFFHSMSGSSKSDAVRLMQMLTNQADGYHEVTRAEDLQFAFGEISENISNGKKIVINIACPVDVTVCCNGETLSSAASSYNDNTSFGSLKLLGKEQDIKVAILDADKIYDIALAGTGNGTMDYTVNYFDENEAIEDFRGFRSVPITPSTQITSSTDRASTVSLNIDSDGDGVVDDVWNAQKNEIGQSENKTDSISSPVNSIPQPPKSSNSVQAWQIVLIVVCVALFVGVLVLVVVLANRSKQTRSPKAAPASRPISLPKQEKQDTDVQTAQIKILSGSMLGMDFPIRDGEILYLGKDPSHTNIVFSSDYKKISRLHCSVEYKADTQKFYVVDTSLNGTYFENHRRFQKGKRTPLASGTIIYLADEQGKIQLC